MSRISNTVTELRTQLTRQFAKSIGGVSGSARKQTNASHVPEGFTLVELMLATTVFSVLLLIGLAGFVQVGRAYYKGITISQTQEVAKQIIDGVTAQISLSSSVTLVQHASNSRDYLCIGSNRYTFKTFNLTDSSSHDFVNNFGLLEDQLPGNSGCPNPFDNPGAVALSNPTELLGNDMRLLAFAITPVAGSPNLYTANISVAFGQDSALSDPTSANAVCKLQLGADQFCAVTNLTTAIYQGS